MKIVIDATEPTLDIREAREDEEGLSVTEGTYYYWREAERRLVRAERMLAEEAIANNPGHPDVLCLREYLKEER